MASDRRSIILMLCYSAIIVLIVFMFYRMGREARYVKEYDTSKAHLSLIKEGAIDRFDQLRASLGTNYPVCKNLPEILEDVKKDEDNLSKSTSYYRKLIEKDELHCGNERKLGWMWIFGRKHIQPWKSTCAENIVPGKRRMYDYLKALCDNQELHNQLHESTKHRVHSTESHKWGNRNGIKYGVIMTGTTHHFKYIYQSILALRNPPSSGISSSSSGSEAGSSSRGKNERRAGINSTDYGWNKHLDVEVWIESKDLKLCEQIFLFGESGKALNGVHRSGSVDADVENSFVEDGSEHHSDHTGPIGTGSVTCRILPEKIKGFTSKFYALLGTEFTDVLFLDSDNVMVRDASELFNSYAYKTTGSLVWPDLWGNQCLIDRGIKGSIEKNSYGFTAFHTHVLFKARIGGLHWQNSRVYAQEAEAGQLVFDLRRHGGLLHLGRLLIEDEHFLKEYSTVTKTFLGSYT